MTASSCEISEARARPERSRMEDGEHERDCRMHALLTHAHAHTHTHAMVR